MHRVSGAVEQERFLIRKYQKMGKRGRSKGGENVWRQDSVFDDRVATRTNEQFEAYYKAQGLIPEGEWDQFMESMRSPLPTTFRITSTGPFARQLRQHLIDEIQHGDLPLSEIKWYPVKDIAWQIDIARRDIRKDAANQRLQSLLKRYNSSGLITRQEAVSMIPPLYLDVHPGQKVLDMCAAPGSKTTQLIEFLYGDEASEERGFVLANDVNMARCQKLIHQLKRLNCANLMVLSEPGHNFPRFDVPTKEGQGKEALLFDRVLCDVPCSSDGTFRKSIELWAKWQPLLGSALHRMQRLLLHRSLELTAVGGKVVYSTCSLNPIEDEAVVGSIVRDWGGAVEICDPSGVLPNLIYSPGVSSWRVPSKDGEFFDSSDAVPKEFRRRVPPSMFPTGDESLHLERCMRVLPHQQNTGGFFICCLQKLAPKPIPRPSPASDAAPQTAGEENPSEGGAAAAAAAVAAGGVEGGEDADAEAEAAAALAATGDGDDDEEEGQKKGGQKQQQPRKQVHVKKNEGQRDDLLRPITDVALIQKIMDFFGVEGISTEQFVTASKTLKHIIYVPQDVMRVVKPAIDAGNDKPRVVSAGVRMFEYTDAQGVSVNYRFRNESIAHFLPHCTKRVLDIGDSDLMKILKDQKKSLIFASIDDDDTRRALLDISSGALLLRLKDSAERYGSVVCVSGWRTNKCIQININHDEVLTISRFLDPTYYAQLMAAEEERANKSARRGGGEEEGGASGEKMEDEAEKKNEGAAAAAAAAAPAADDSSSAAAAQ